MEVKVVEDADLIDFGQLEYGQAFKFGHEIFIKFNNTFDSRGDLNAVQIGKANRIWINSHIKVKPVKSIVINL
jgi:hypothetical protein